MHAREVTAGAKVLPGSMSYVCVCAHVCVWIVKFFGLASWKDAAALIEMERFVGRRYLGGKIRSSVLDMFLLICLLFIQDVSLIRMHYLKNWQKVMTFYKTFCCGIRLFQWILCSWPQLFTWVHFCGQIVFSQEIWTCVCRGQPRVTTKCTCS